MLSIVWKRRKSVLTGVFLLFFFMGTAYAAFPDKPVTLVVGRGAGGSTDAIGRTFAPFLSKYLGVPVPVKNVKGAGGQIANKMVYNTDPDGYTLIMGVFASDVIQQLRKKPPYDFREFTCIHGIAGGDTNGLIVPYDSKIKSFEDILAASKKKRAGLTIAGVAIGSNSWLFAQLLKQEAGFKATYVPFDSGREATMSVVGGHVTGGAASSINFPGLLKDKKIRVLGLASDKRLFYLPDTPTFSELGYPGVVFKTEQFLMGPPKIASDKIKILESAAAKAVADPEFLSLSKKQGFTVDSKSADKTREELLKIFAYVKKILIGAGEKVD